MLLIGLFVAYIVIMIVWGLQNLGAVDIKAAQSWLAFFSCVILGIVVFLVGSGMLSNPPTR